MSASSDGKPLRFAALIRVSTEKQERQGESLRTQRKQIEQAVAQLGGEVVRWYGGQEHATAGWERAELERLLIDAETKRKTFAAVMVANADRWSRDNVQNEIGLNRLKDAGVRFFVLQQEHDLYTPEARLYLAMTATIGEYQARNQNKKSIESRIERAKRGRPSCGKRPFGRIWDKERECWQVDPAKKALIADVAERYLAGESLSALAKEHGINHSHLCKVLRERCGDTWSVKFEPKGLNICETVELKVPRLLPEKTIRAVRQRLTANRTYAHKPPKPKYEYLLSGHVFCAECGYAMFGQMNHGNRRYYRHAHSERTRACSINPRPWVRADALEQTIVSHLFNTLGNPAAIERAVKAAIPEDGKARRRAERIKKEIAKIERARNRVLGLIEKDLITDEQAEQKVRELKDREAKYQQELDQLAATLANVPDEDGLKYYVERIGDGIMLLDQYGNRYAGGNDVQSFLAMNGKDRRKLIETAFAAPTPGGAPAGVYLTPAGGKRHGSKRFNYDLKGQLPIGTGRVVPRAKHCTTAGLLGLRSCAGSPRHRA